MQETSIYLLAETLINQNIRTNESTIVLNLLSILVYYSLITITAFIIRKLHIFARLVATLIAIVFNVILLLKLSFQLSVGNILLNALSKLAANGQAPIFKNNLLNQGIDPGIELSIINENLLKFFLVLFCIFGIIVPVYLYLFAKWENN